MSLLVLLILTATLLGNYYYSLFAEGETKALPGCKVMAVPWICDVPYGEGRIQWQRLKEAVRLWREPGFWPNHKTLGDSLNAPVPQFS